MRCLTGLAGGTHSPHVSHAVHIAQLQAIDLREGEGRGGEKRNKRKIEEQKSGAKWSGET
jgi:hypothetical protein